MRKKIDTDQGHFWNDCGLCCYGHWEVQVAADHITYRYIDPSRHNFENCLPPQFVSQSCLGRLLAAWPAKGAMRDKSWKISDQRFNVHIYICNVQPPSPHTRWKQRAKLKYKLYYWKGITTFKSPWIIWFQSKKRAKRGHFWRAKLEKCKKKFLLSQIVR